MAGENLGSVYYTVDADTNGMITAEGKITKSIDRVNTKFTGLDTKVTKTSKSVRSGMASMGRSAGQAGIQLQQFIGQIQGGQSAMLALSQQSADLGFVLGAPLLGAVTGIAASLIGMLIPSLFDSSDAADGMYSSMEELNSLVAVSQTGVNALSNEYAALAKSSAEASKVQLALALSQASQSLTNAREVIKSSSEELEGLTDNIMDAGDALDILRKSGKDVYGQVVELDKFQNANFGTWADLTNVVKGAQKQFGLTSVNAYKLVSALIDVNRYASEDNLNALDQAMADIAEETGYSNATLTEFISTVSKATSEGRKSIDAWRLLQDVLRGTSDQTSDNIDAIDSMISALQEQAKAVSETARQTAIRTATEKGATQAQIAAINAAFNQIDAERSKQEAIRESIKAEEDEIDAMLRLRKEHEQLQAQREKRAKTVTTRVETIASGVDPVTELQAQRDKQLALVREYEELETAEHQVAVDARKAIDDEYNANLAAAQEARFVAQSESNRMLIDGINSLGDAASSVLTGMLTQTLDLRSAMLGFANAVLNSAVNAIIQMGIEHVKAAVIGQAADQAAATAKATTQAAAAAQHTAAVTATVAELTSLAAAGAFAATAAIPIVGPAAAPAAAAEAGTATSGIGAAAIAAAPIAGMRLYGGPTSPNSLYKVNEDGRPEMFSDGRDSFLMTGSRGGEVTSNGDLGKSETPINIVVNNNAPNSKAMASYDQESRTVTIAVNEVGRQFRENKGAAFDGLVAGTTANGRAI